MKAVTLLSIRWSKEWLARVTDLIDQVHPDLLYTDGALPFGEVGRQMLTHYYNSDLGNYPSRVTRT